MTMGSVLYDEAHDAGFLAGIRYALQTARSPGMKQAATIAVLQHLEYNSADRDIVRHDSGRYFTFEVERSKGKLKFKNFRIDT